MDLLNDIFVCHHAKGIIRLQDANGQHTKHTH